MDRSRGLDSEIRTLSSSLSPFLFCWLHPYLGFPHMAAHSNPTFHYILVEKEHLFSSIPSKHPRTDSHWTALSHMFISGPITGASHELCWYPGKSESLAYSWSPRVGVSPTRMTEIGRGEITLEKTWSAVSRRRKSC